MIAINAEPLSNKYRPIRVFKYLEKKAQYCKSMSLEFQLNNVKAQSFY